LAQQQQFPLGEIYVIDGSTRSSHSNAYFYGLAIPYLSVKRLVLFDTLLVHLSPIDIVAVVGHELGHFKLSHMVKSLVLTQLYVLGYLWLSGQFLYNLDLYQAFDLLHTCPSNIAPVSTLANQHCPHLVGLILFSMCISPIDFLFTFAMNWVSRKHEYEADAFATDLGLDLVPALTRLHTENLSNMNPHPWYSTYHFSHPTLTERIAAIHSRRLLIDKKRADLLPQVAREHFQFPAKTNAKESRTRATPKDLKFD